MGKVDRVRYAIFGVREDGTDFLVGLQTYKTREEAEKKLPLLSLIFSVRNIRLEIRPF